MIKRTAFLLIFSIALILSGCSKDALQQALDNTRSNDSGSADEDYGYEDSAEKLTDDTTFYNGYLGFSYTVPSGWWIYDVNADNFSDSARTTGSASLLDIYFGENYKWIDMAYIGNLQYSSRDNHVGVNISAESIDGISTLEDYIAEYIAFMLEPYDGDPYTLLESDTTEINGRAFEQCVFEVGQEERPYRIVSLTCEVADGYYLTLSGNYWPDNKQALDNIRQFVADGLEFL